MRGKFKLIMADLIERKEDCEKLNEKVARLEVRS
jgi:hypothetical protein